jgi:hypothetical protein
MIFFVIIIFSNRVKVIFGLFIFNFTATVMCVNMLDIQICIIMPKHVSIPSMSQVRDIQCKQKMYD